MVKQLRNILEKGEDEVLEFDERYNAATKAKIATRKKYYKDFKLFEKLLADNKEVITQLQKKPRAKALTYYDKILTTPKRFDELRKQKKKVVGIYCNVVPEELIYAADAIPVRLCSGCNEAVAPGEEAFPRDSCPVIKSAMGFAVVDDAYFKLSAVLIIPATCDGKKKMGEVLNDYKPVWMLDLPQNKERTRAKKQWLAEIRILKKRLEELTGNKITRKKLQKAIRLLHERYDVTRRLMEIRKGPPVISGQDAFIVMQACFFDDITSWIKRTNLLCDELEDMAEQKKYVADKNAPRILLTGAPFILPNFKIPSIIEEHNGFITIDETCAGSQYHYDPVQVDEWSMLGMMQAISERYLMPSVCPCFIESEDRVDKLLEMMEAYDIDAVIYHTLRLCLLFDVEAMKIRDILQDKGTPFLHLNTDYSKEDNAQLQNRIEAFIEIINQKK